ncbi:hypothetical protein PFISCL1PPCAC_19081, partial [Pristionchus fissidentatus]
KVATLLFVAFLRLPGNEELDKLKKRIDDFNILLMQYYLIPSAKYMLLEGIKIHLSSMPSFSPLVVDTIKYLVDDSRRIISKKAIIDWYEDLMKDEEKSAILPLAKEVVEALM